MLFKKRALHTLRWPADPLHTQWPQAFYVSGALITHDLFEVRPLTVAGLIKGVGRNFAAMTYWRLMRLLVILGLLATPELERIRWSHVTLRFWRTWMPGRLYPVRWYRKLYRAAADRVD